MKKLPILLLAIALPAHAVEPVRAPHAMVTSVSEIASRVGADVMKKGGNAVDAAVAVAFTLAVVWPEAGNIAGGGFMLVRTADGKSVAIDYRERAPLAATRDMYLDAKGDVIPHASTIGYRAAAVPGTVAGLALAHRRYGKRPWRELVEPARKLAADGFVVWDRLAYRMDVKEVLDKLNQFPESRRVFLHGDGTPLRAGETFRQPDLAATLARIAANPRDFYTGRIARALVRDVRAHGGLLSMKDLAAYQPRVRTPLRGSYRGYEIVTFPPPSSGGVVLIEMLNMLETQRSRDENFLIEVMRRGYAERAQWIADPDFVHVPVKGLADKRYATTRIADFDPQHPSGSAEVAKASNPTAYESEHTTHFTIVDRDGNAVSNTYTLNDDFGSGATIKGLGFLLNDEMDDFTAKPGVPNVYGLITGKANAIAPKKRPTSSMTPTMIVKDGKLWLALGSPGGGKIISAVLQTIINVIDRGMNLQDAVEAPRLHHQWMPDEIWWEEGRVDLAARQRLEALGYKFKSQPELNPNTLGDVKAIMIDPASGERLGACDDRRGGAAVGW